MSYVQIIEFVTRDPQQMKDLGEKYLQESAGTSKVKRAMIYHDRAEPKRYVAVVEFENREDSFDNENMPEYEDFAEGLAELSEIPLVYRSLELAHAIVP